MNSGLAFPPQLERAVDARKIDWSDTQASAVLYLQCVLVTIGVPSRTHSHSVSTRTASAQPECVWYVCDRC